MSGVLVAVHAEESLESASLWRLVCLTAAVDAALLLFRLRGWGLDWWCW